MEEKRQTMTKVIRRQARKGDTEMDNYPPENGADFIVHASVGPGDIIGVLMDAVL